MSGKMKRMLVLLLILLKEARPTAACSCSTWFLSCDCRSRGFSSVPQDLPTSTISLYLFFNVITTLSQSDFSRYSRLITLRLYYNQISVINSGAFYNLVSLSELLLNNNHLTGLRADMFVGLGNLETLHLFSNNIRSIEAGTFSSTPQLRHLQLHNNSIHSIEARTFVNLPQLRTLRLHNNHLTSITVGTFKGLDNLENLDLHHNNISSIEPETFHVIPQLHYLRLENNYLPTIAEATFVNLPNLQTLDLHVNNIITIEAGALVNLPALRTLYLSHNNISTFPIEDLSTITTSKLSSLNMDYNQMETLPPMAYDVLASIRTVDISNNPWQCDCRILSFKHRMTGGPEFEKQMTCAGPSKVQGKSLYSVDYLDLILDLILGPICQETATSPGASADGTSPSPGSADGTSPSSFSLPLFLSSLGGVLVGAFLTSAVYSAAWCKIRRRKTTPNPVKYPRYRYASPRTAPSPELSLSLIDLNAEDTSVV